MAKRRIVCHDLFLLIRPDRLTPLPIGQRHGAAVDIMDAGAARSNRLGQTAAHHHTVPRRQFSLRSGPRKMPMRIYAVDHPDLPPMEMPPRFRHDIAYS